MDSIHINYLTDEEYDNIFIEFCFFRQKVVSELLKFGLDKRTKVLDVAAGHGFLSFAIRDSGYKGRLVDIGLLNDLNSYEKAISSKEFNSDNIQYVIMSTANLAFRDNSFDLIANFLGLEDINMTLGREGVKSTLEELGRILRKDGILEITIMLKGKDPSSIINWKLWRYVGLNSLFYSPHFYIKLLEKLGCVLLKKFILRTNKNITLNQAKEEILFACEEAPKLFRKYGVKAKPFQKVWSKFNKKIKRYGLGFYPEILVLIFKK
ncbi:MAG: class I SAM-dependent methyltransferase [Candidatus Hodarchaeota archaeon]